MINNIFPTLSLSDIDNLKDIANLFPKSVKRYWLEIGFGSGENIKWQLQNNLDIGFIGCEPYINGIANLLDILDEEELKKIKIFQGSINNILPSFKSNTFDKVFLLFPDPWPKKKHHKRRIIQNKFLCEISRIMKIEGELRIASDDYSYACWIMHHILRNNSLRWKAKCINDILIQPYDWPKTKYQEKANIKNRQSYYFKLIKEIDNF